MTASKHMTTSTRFVRHHSLEDLFWSHLDNLDDSERTMGKSLASLTDGVRDVALRRAFEDYSEETRRQVEFLEEFLSRGVRRGKSFPADFGSADWRAKGRKLWRGYFDSHLRDAGIVIAVRFLAEYKVATYRAAVEWAELLGYDELLSVLKRCMRGEQAAVDRLSSMAGSQS